ncbi:MAG: PEP-CTERM sorting domain-containing protein [Verrucomicrobiales bacterium]|jgi:hypothetical protein|nr:PEP-CTERM sorting domain-containing protein [Verrucomicrobiales bacterium]
MTKISTSLLSSVELWFTSIPEPSIYFLLGVGLGVLFILKKIGQQNA